MYNGSGKCNKKASVTGVGGAIGDEENMLLIQLCLQPSVSTACNTLRIRLGGGWLSSNVIRFK